MQANTNNLPSGSVPASGNRRVTLVTTQVQIRMQSRYFYIRLKLSAVFSHSLRNQLSDLKRSVKQAYQKKA